MQRHGGCQMFLGWLIAAKVFNWRQLRVLLLGLIHSDVYVTRQCLPGWRAAWIAVLRWFGRRWGQVLMDRVCRFWTALPSRTARFGR